MDHYRNYIYSLLPCFASGFVFCCHWKYLFVCVFLPWGLEQMEDIVQFAPCKRMSSAQGCPSPRGLLRRGRWIDLPGAADASNIL